jgi:hypothetical protein
VVQTWIWFAVGIAYVFIGVFNYRSARRLRDADIPSANRNAIAYPNGERERLRELDIQAMAAVAGRLEKEEMGQSDAQSSTDAMKWGHFLLNIDEVLENLNNSFDYFDRFVAEFNNATKINRRVLKFAALSFFLAAAISFAQGFLLI